MRIALLLVLAVMLSFSVGCRKGAPVQNVQATTSTAVSEKKFTEDEVRKAILRAASTRGWVARELSPGNIEATLRVRGKHTVVVDIPYSAGKYDIKYKSSVNMEYNASTGKIHPNYNKWVNTLRGDIDANLYRTPNL